MKFNLFVCLHFLYIISCLLFTDFPRTLFIYAHAHMLPRHSKCRTLLFARAMLSEEEEEEGSDYEEVSCSC